MKKILLQKGRDEVGASLRATPQPPAPARDPEPPLRDKPTPSPIEHQRNTPSSVECFQIATPGGVDRVATPSGERHQPRSEYHALLPTVTSHPMTSHPVTSHPMTSHPVTSLSLLMLPISPRGGASLDKFYPGESNQGAFGLQAYPGFYRIDEGRFPGMNPSRLFHYGMPADDERVDFQVMRQESSYGHPLCAPVRLEHEEVVSRMRKSVEQRFDESRDYARTGFSGAVSAETLRREREVAMEAMRREAVAMETMRREVAMDLVSSSDIVEGKGCLDVVEVDSEDEDRRMRSRSVVRSSDDPVEGDLPRMIDKARRMTSPSETTGEQDDSKTANSPRSSDLQQSFKSPAAASGSLQKTVYRPKGRPTKAAASAAAASGVGGGDSGPPGTRSIIRCPVCAKQFNNSSALAKHKLTHSDERKYACSLCNKAFKRQDHLNGHMMTHSSMKPFACKFIGCNKSYCDARSLRRHMENHHQECSNTIASASGPSTGFFSFERSPFQQGYGTEGAPGPGGDGSVSYLQQVSPISPVGGVRGSPQSSSARQSGGGGGGTGGVAPQGQMWVTGYNPLDEPKPVKCHVCGRGFKNIPALNGHMRLHGGYIRKDQENVDESQDVSRSSDTRTESRFSLSENSQSSASISDRHHESLPGSLSSFAAGSQPIGLEPGRRHFFLSSADADMGRGGLEKLLMAEREEVRVRAEEAARNCIEQFRGRSPYERFGVPERHGARTVSGSRETGEFQAGDLIALGGEFETRGRRDSEQPADGKCSSPRMGQKHEDEFPKNFPVKSRNCEEDRPAIVQIMRLAGHQMTSGVQKLFEQSGGSIAFERDKAKTEINRPGPISVGASSHVHQLSSPEEYVRKARGVEEATHPPPVEEVVSAKAGGAEFPSTVGGPQRHSKSGASHRMDCAETPQRKREKVRDEKMSASGDECFPDSTSGRDDTDGGNTDRKTRGVNPEESPFTAGDPQNEATYTEPRIPEGDMRRLGENSAPEGFRGTSSPPHAGLSPSNRQSACLYRQRWMNLQLRQGGQRCPDVPGERSPQGSSCGASTYGTGTDCGDPSTPKPNHRTPKETSNAHPLADLNRHVRNAAASVGSCPSGGGSATGFLPPRSGPTSPVLQTSPLAWKYGGSSSFSYPAVVSPAIVHGCHNPGLTNPRGEGLHHVHSNSCMTSSSHTDPGTSYVQSHIPCSPYDPRPHTPCAAHTPYTPCQPYTPHTPYTPCTANRPSTPKHASHFEFPPRICLQESSMCDSPYPTTGQAQLPGHQVEIRLAVEPEDHRSYHPLEKFGMEVEHLCQHGYGDRRDLISSTDMDIDRPRKHLQAESDSRLNLLWQRDFDRQKQPHTGTGHPGRQSEARNPEDGFAASLPTGAKRNTPGMALNCSAERPEKTERKRKPSEDLSTPVETKRCVTDRTENRNFTESTGRDSSRAEQVSSSCGARLKTEERPPAVEDAEREEGESDRQKGFRVGCAAESYDGETVFRNPPSPLKVKKSRPRPEPLFIPANVNHFGFQSRLRSPRLWDGLTKQMAPPYTPPPMLSPARSGSGLFWKLHSGFPSPLTGPPVLPKYDKVKCTSSWPEVTPPPTADERQPPETDLQPHINIGPEYQPDLPHFLGSKPSRQEYSSYDDRSTLVWNPNTAAKLKEEEVTQYMQYACCAIIPGNGANHEYAMHILHLCKGDLKKAVKLLLEPEPKLPRSSGLKTYKYQDCVKWKKIEIDLFHKAIMKLDKDFFQISKMVGSKSVKDCVQFYYLWKKICPDELKQLKVLRRKREQYELYSRRSKDLRDQPPKQPIVRESQKSSQEKSNRSSKKHERMEALDFQFQDSTGKPVTLKEDQVEDSDAEKQWCAICKRSFTSVRNFGVHVKMHERNRVRRGESKLDVVAKLPCVKLGSGV